MSTLALESDCHNGKCGSCAPSTNCQDADIVLGQCFTEPFEVTSLERDQMMAQIDAYSFDQVRYRLNTEGIVPSDQVETAIVEFRKFLQVIVNADGPVGMISETVDEVWHAFILHTVDYTKFCIGVLGRFLHHTPNTPDTPSAPDAGVNFVSTYNRLFGELDPIWGVITHSDCEKGSSCEACSTACEPNCNIEYAPPS